jgi:hypothetical protein
VIGLGEMLRLEYAARNKKKSRDAAAAAAVRLTETNERCQADKPETRAANQRIIPSVLFHHGRQPVHSFVLSFFRSFVGSMCARVIISRRPSCRKIIISALLN